MIRPPCFHRLLILALSFSVRSVHAADLPNIENYWKVEPSSVEWLVDRPLIHRIYEQSPTRSAVVCDSPYDQYAKVGLPNQDFLVVHGQQLFTLDAKSHNMVASDTSRWTVRRYRHDSVFPGLVRDSSDLWRTHPSWLVEHGQVLLDLTIRRTGRGTFICHATRPVNGETSPVALDPVAAARWLAETAVLGFVKGPPRDERRVARYRALHSDP